VDDRTFAIVVGMIIAVVLLLILDAVLVSFELPGGFWTFPSAIIGLLAAQSAYRTASDRRNGNGGNGK
jgi:uncharacterized integral membrane protein